MHMSNTRQVKTNQTLRSLPLKDKPKRMKSDDMTTVEWKDVNWRKLELRVYKLQKRIFRASSRKDVLAVRKLQKTLMKSWSAKMLAVRRVTQDNQGKKTAGIDGVKSLTPKQRLKLVTQLRLNSKVKPTRRVWIPKPGTEEKRPLGILTMYDRALQALVKLALEPEWEALFEPNSYGFRPGRSSHDAIDAIYKKLSQKARYVLDADIAKCFDKIDHDALLRKLNTFPTIRRQVRAWLKAGVMDGNTLFPTSLGTPQGGVISPLLANIALHGMENRISQAFPARKIQSKGKYLGYCSEAKLIRYAGDFCILHEDLTVVQRCQQIISEWLTDMELELKPSKTRITHTFESFEGQKPGFDFLGFNVRQYPAGKYRSDKNGNKDLLGFVTIIKPSSKKIKVHSKVLHEEVKAHKQATQKTLIEKLNPIIRGWANYYSTVSSKKIFSKIDSIMYHQLRAWAKRRHPKKKAKWIANRYWMINQGKGWTFASLRGKFIRLKKHSETPIIEYVKVQGERSPYDGDTTYWSIRMGRHPEVPMRVATLLKKQKGKCPHCKLTFKDGDLMEVHHIIPRSTAGEDKYNNFQLLHRHCHDKVTAQNAVGNKRARRKSKPPKPKKGNEVSMTKTKSLRSRVR